MTFICQQQSMRRQPSASHIKNSCDRGTARYLRLLCPLGADPKYPTLCPPFSKTLWRGSRFCTHLTDIHHRVSSVHHRQPDCLVRGSIACDSPDLGATEHCPSIWPFAFQLLACSGSATVMCSNVPRGAYHIETNRYLPRFARVLGMRGSQHLSLVDSICNQFLRL